MNSRTAKIAGAVASAIVALSLILTYYKSGDNTATAFKALARMDVILLLLSLVSAGGFAASMFMPIRALQPALVGLTSFIFGVLFFNAIELTHQFRVDLGFGGIIGLLAGLVIVAAAYASLLLPDIAVVRPGAAAPGAGPAGAGPGGPTVAPGGPPGGFGEPGPAAPTSVGEPGPGDATRIGGPGEPAGTPPGAAPADTGAAPADAGGGPPPGWYPDPHGIARQRYWDGSTWTDHVQS